MMIDRTRLTAVCILEYMYIKTLKHFDQMNLSIILNVPCLVHYNRKNYNLHIQKNARFVCAVFVG